MIVTTYTLSIPGHIEVTFLNYGGIIQSIKVPDKNGAMGDVVLGFDQVEKYLQPHPYFGAIIGRYANRIHLGEFIIDGEKYHCPLNFSPSCLHGGTKGFDKVFWEVTKDTVGEAYTLKYSSPHMEMGFPGNLTVEVTYTLTQQRELVIDYKATTDRPTIINLTNHSYFNLSGGKETILDHELWINADHVLAVNDELIPSGDIFSVKGAKDFREHKSIGRDISHPKNGYDFNYVLNQAPLSDPKARLYHRTSGRSLEIFTTEPGLQFYSGNFLDGSISGKKGQPYQKHMGLCLEPQHFPDSPHHPHFPSTILRPSEPFTSKTIYKFHSK